MEGRLDRLDGVEVAVLAQQGSAKNRQQPIRIAAAVEVARDKTPRLIDLLLTVQQSGHRGQQRGQFLDRFVVRFGNLRRRDVEETVQVDAQRRVEDAAQQFG